MATTSGSVTVLDHCLVTPPPAPAAGATEMSLPLTFMDMLWLHFSPIQRLVFYEFPQLSKSQFVDETIPKLKNSLSLTMKYFLPLAGNLIIPRDVDSGMPEIRYSPGSSVSLVFAEYRNIDFNDLVANDDRDCAEFHRLIPELKSSSHPDHSGSVVSTTPVLALQVTLFPNVGLSIGISNHHTVGDARSIFNFLKTWAIFHSKLSEVNDIADADAELLVNVALPIFDKTLIKDPKGLAKIMWEQWNAIVKPENSATFDDQNSLKMTTKTNKVRRTFVITQKDVDKLKNSVLKKRGKLVHLSSFTVICSYVWTCHVKSRLVNQGKNIFHEEGENDEHRLFAAECRERVDPPLPANSFGNCLTDCSTVARTEQLTGEGGFQVAAELVGRAIHEKFKRKHELFDGFEFVVETLKTMNWDKVVSVAGSTRYNYYNLDFGWGKPIKFEFISIDETGAISLSGCRGSDGDVEVGLSLTKSKMNAFSTIFMEGFEAL